MRTSSLLCAVLVACGDPEDPVRPGDTGDPPVEDTAPPDDTAPPEDTAPPDDTAPPEDTAPHDDTAPPDDTGEDPVVTDCEGRDIGIFEGQCAPNFTLQDQHGVDHTLYDYAGSVIFVEFIGFT